MSELELLTSGINRLFTERHAWLMYGLCKWTQARRAVEIGAFHGFTSVFIAKALKENGGGRLTIYDDFSLQNDCATLHNNLQRAGVADIVTIKAVDSQKVQRIDPVDFAFIDGNHSLEGCLHDCNLAIEAGAKCVAIHDTVGWWGPRKYLELFREQSGELWDVFEGNFDSGLGVLMKREPKPEPHYTRETNPDGLVHFD